MHFSYADPASDEFSYVATYQNAPKGKAVL